MHVKYSLTCIKYGITASFLLPAFLAHPFMKINFDYSHRDYFGLPWHLLVSIVQYIGHRMSSPPALPLLLPHRILYYWWLRACNHSAPFKVGA